MRKSKSAIFVIVTAFMLSLAPALLANSAKVHVDVGLNHFYKHRYLDAYKEFKQATEVDPTYAEAYYNLGRVYKAQGFMKEAIVEFQLAVRLKPDYVAAQRELEALNASFATDSDRQIRAQGRQNFRQTEFSSMSAEDIEMNARKMLNQGKTDEAIRYYTMVVKERPNDVSCRKMLGFLNFKSNKFTDSLEQYQAARKLAPTDAEIPYAIGLIYMKTGTPAKAEGFFKDAVKLNSSMIKAYFALGEAYEAQGKIDDAVFQFRKCLELNSNLKEAQNKLDYLIGKQGYNYFSRGSYHYQRGEYEQALPLLSMARNYGNLTADQQKQVEEMLNASQYWVNKQQAEKRVVAERQQVLNKATMSRSITVSDVCNNANAYVGKAVEWEGVVEFIEEEYGRLKICVNTDPKTNASSNMNGCFMITLPKAVKRDERISESASTVSVKGKITKVAKIYYDGYGYSSRKQPIVEAVEIEFRRDGYDSPLVIRF